MKDKLRSVIKLMHCTVMGLIHPICHEVGMNRHCAEAINKQSTDAIINSCKFNFKNHIEPYALLAGGGILIMSADKISANSQVLANTVPVIIYSSGNVEIIRNAERYLIFPEILSTTTTVVTSSITAEDITKLKRKIYWEEMLDSQSTENYIDYGLILFEILSLPLLLYGFIKSCKRTGMLTKSNVREANVKKDTKAIFRRNRALLAQEE